MKLFELCEGGFKRMIGDIPYGDYLQYNHQPEKRIFNVAYYSSRNRIVYYCRTTANDEQQAKHYCFGRIRVFCKNNTQHICPSRDDFMNKSNVYTSYQDEEFEAYIYNFSQKQKV